jgi:hypothetical protein
MFGKKPAVNCKAVGNFAVRYDGSNFIAYLQSTIPKSLRIITYDAIKRNSPRRMPWAISFYANSIV